MEKPTENTMDRNFHCTIFSSLLCCNMWPFVLGKGDQVLPNVESHLKSVH